jgi:hypothetical protein
MVSATAALIRARWPTMPAGEVINRIIKTAKDRGAPGRDNVYGYGLVDPTGALTAQVPAVVDNPLDTTPDPGIAGFGNAPAAGQALSAPESVRAGRRAAQVPGANAGQVVRAADQPVRNPAHGWWVATGLLLLSMLVGLLTIRRFARLI